MSELKACHDCAAEPGSPHDSGCDVERCSVCHGQWISCGCHGHDPAKSLWTGLWPGVAECRELGWFCQDGFGPDRRWGSFCPCGPDAPGAMEDLNRWTMFRMTGEDTLYNGCTRVPRTR